MTENGEYIFYADESGDHSLMSIDPEYPIFVLNICCFRKVDYCKRVVPAFQDFKFRYFGHDMVVLHERDIRKQFGPFAIMTDPELRHAFLNDLSDQIAAARFRIFSAVIDKRSVEAELVQENPYALALRFLLEEIFKNLRRKGVQDKRHFFVFEKRGDKEDTDLELEFRRVADGWNSLRKPFQGFNIVFGDKKANSTGLQIADLTARPTGLNFLRHGQPNRAFEIIRPKLEKIGTKRKMQGGLLAYRPPESI
ncbi:DUF3800 domain-containing protein [Martelella limonii]|uniref:DUF3800 domain-containing protein n=1 Tax=Martelella limonii TaxID=1647649 RepID=UPI0015801BAC|nr:DUF3800 domain-containing protein [Martelella limonii]